MAGKTDISSASLELLEVKFEKLQKRLNLPLPPTETAMLRTAFFAGVSAGLDLNDIITT